MHEHFNKIFFGGTLLIFLLPSLISKLLIVRIIAF